MNKKFMMPFGFVLMLVMATAISPAEASIKDTFKDTRVNVDPLTDS